MMVGRMMPRNLAGLNHFTLHHSTISQASVRREDELAAAEENFGCQQEQSFEPLIEHS